MSYAKKWDSRKLISNPKLLQLAIVVILVLNQKIMNVFIWFKNNHSFEQCI